MHATRSPPSCSPFSCTSLAIVSYSCRRASACCQLSAPAKCALSSDAAQRMHSTRREAVSCLTAAQLTACTCQQCRTCIQVKPQCCQAGGAAGQRVLPLQRSVVAQDAAGCEAGMRALACDTALAPAEGACACCRSAHLRTAAAPPPAPRWQRAAWRHCLVCGLLLHIE